MVQVNMVEMVLGELIVLQENVLEGELRFFALTPSRFIVEVDIGALFERFADSFWVFVALEPCEVFGVVSPGLSFEFSGGEVLLISVLLEVKEEKEEIRRELLEGAGIIKKVLSRHRGI